MLFDTMPGGPELARFADQASDGFAGVSDDELLGIVCAWDRVQAHAAARKYAAVAELIRRRPAAGWPVDNTTQMPQVWDEFTPSELSAVLAESKGGGPKCRQDHRLKQHSRWKVQQLPDGTFRWTTPSGRTCTTEPTRYPI